MTEHTAENDATLALADNVRAMLRLLTPDDITPVGRRQIERVLDEHTRVIAPGEGTEQ